MSNEKQFFINLDRDFIERYEPERFMEYSDNYDILTSDFMSNLKNIPASGRFLVQGQDSRPDLVSYEIYKDVQYWWLLMYYNNYSSVSDIVTGKEMRYPSQTDLEQYYFSLKSKQATE